MHGRCLLCKPHTCQYSTTTKIDHAQRYRPHTPRAINHHQAPLNTCCRRGCCCGCTSRHVAARQPTQPHQPRPNTTTTSSTTTSGSTTTKPRRQQQLWVQQNCIHVDNLHPQLVQETVRGLHAHSLAGLLERRSSHAARQAAGHEHHHRVRTRNALEGPDADVVHLQPHRHAALHVGALHLRAHVTCPGVECVCAECVCAE